MQLLLHVLLFCLLLATATSQEIKIKNFSGAPYKGWIRCNIDLPPAFEAGRTGTTHYVVGQPNGLDTRPIDIFVDLPAGGSTTLALRDTTPAAFVAPPLPADLLAHFGGVPTLNGAPLLLTGATLNGAALEAHLVGRFGKMFQADLWVRWYPDQPGWAHGELLVTCSNLTVPDVQDQLTQPLTLTFGDAVVVVPGRAPGTPVMDPQTFGDGQARALPLTFVWLRHLTDPSSWASVGAAANMLVSAVGIHELWHDGNPIYPDGFTGRVGQQLFPDAVRRLHTWEPGAWGPPARSGQSGFQEDSGFIRGEALLPEGNGAEIVTYLSGLKMAHRPCHHLQRDGRPVDGANFTNPRLVFWDGRPHWHTGVSPERLGKTTSAPTVFGWTGPDTQHWFLSTLYAGARYTGSPLLNRLLEHQAHVYMLQSTTTPGWSTSAADSPRSVAWECIGAHHLTRQLSDRQLAWRVRDHIRQRINTVILPEYGDRDHWMVFVNDPRLGTGEWWIAWQQSAGSWALDMAGRMFDVPAARGAAIQAAQTVVNDAWVQVNGRWQSRAQLPVAGGGPSNESFNYYGMAMAVALLAREQPNNAKAQAIWAQLTQEADSTTDTRWLPPAR